MKRALLLSHDLENKVDYQVDEKTAFWLDS